VTLIVSPQQVKDRLFPFGQAAAPGAQADPAYFLVSSCGFSGSIWLAGSLNLHDAVCATVGIDNPVESFSYCSIHKDAAYFNDNAGAALSAYGFTNRAHPLIAGFKATLDAHGVDMPIRDLARLPWYVLEELELVPAIAPYRVLGNVHGTTLWHLHQAHLADPDFLKGRQVVVVDLIRHPVPRTEAAIKAVITFHVAELDSRISEFLHENAAECLALERRYSIDFSEPRPRAALHVFRQGTQNDLWAYEIREYAHAPRILLERLQDDRDYFAHVFFTLTQGRLSADTTYLDRVFAPENLVSGRQSGEKHARAPRAREQYDLWSPFERAEFARVTERANLPRLYFPYGYDLSFVSRSAAGEGSWFSRMVS
jgi:hypothetical protein